MRTTTAKLLMRVPSPFWGISECADFSSEELLAALISKEKAKIEELKEKRDYFATKELLDRYDQDEATRADTLQSGHRSQPRTPTEERVHEQAVPERTFPVFFFTHCPTILKCIQHQYVVGH